MKLIKIGAVIGTLATLSFGLSMYSVWRWVKEMDQTAEDVSTWWDDAFEDYEWDDDWDDDWVDGGWEAWDNGGEAVDPV